jgi:putative ABC transport system permease protein
VNDDPGCRGPWRIRPPRMGLLAIVASIARAGGLAAALLIGALAGLLPAIRAARLSPTQALWTL